MARFAKGSRALAISDRSGAAFPYKEMVQEWTGAWVHISEFEPKQPQLEPHPVGADPQGLLHARPARVEFPVQDILPNNPFTTTAASKTLSVSFPDNGLNAGTSYVRFSNLKQIVGGVAITTLELSTTLNGNLTDSATSIVLTDGSEFPTAGAYTNASDAPYRFVPCMVSGLAYYLSMKFAPQRTQEMKLLYEDEFARALSEDGSAASTYITPKTYYPNV